MKKPRQTAFIGVVSRLAGAGLLFALAAILSPLVARAESDLDAYLRGKMFRMWVNDDADIADGEDDFVDIPNQSNADCKDDHVNGRRDLVDFFPMWLNISPFQPWLESGKVGVGLMHPDAAINIVWTSLGNLEAGKFHREDIGGCGPNLDQAAHTAAVVRVTAAGINVPDNVLAMIAQDSSKGVMMAEGVRPSSAPLVIVFFDKTSRQVLYSFGLPLCISHVEDMYRWANIRAAAGGDVGTGRESRLSEPSGLPDSDTNGKHFLFVHGYSVSEEKARGWGAEMFKRMWQAGANCAFTAVTWYGDDSRHWWYLDNTPNYYVNVEHAFESASALTNIVAQLSGEKVIAAHSLGNMLVSSAIADHGMQVSSYFMLNAAVPMEAYDPDEITPESSHNMANPDWHNYTNRLWASRWHEAWKRIDPNDGRCDLTWRGRFASITNAYNYYSEGEEVLANGDGDTHPILSGDFAWYNQESRKGLWPMLLPGNNEAGWSFNGAYDNFLSHMNPTNAAELADLLICTNSFFGLFDERGLYGTNGSFLATQPAIRAHALADGIPAESYAAGANAIAPEGSWIGRNVDMPMKAKVAWGSQYGIPDEGEQGEAWRHSDIKNRPYQVVRDVFLSIIEKGSLK